MATFHPSKEEFSSFKNSLSSLFVNYFNSCSDDVTLFPWVMCKWTRGPWATTLTFLKIDKHKWLSKCWLREEKTQSLYVNLMVLHLNKLGSPSSKDALCQVWLKLVQWFLRRRFLNFVNVILLFHNYLPLEKGRALHLNKLESPSPSDALSQVWLKLVQLFLRRRFFKILSMYFCYFVIFSP